MGITKLYKKYYTMKEWNRFTINWQQRLTNKYDVILTDHKTRSEKLRGIFNGTNLNKNLDRVQGGIESFSKALEKFDMSNFKIFPGVSQKEYNALVGKPSKRNYSTLTGSSKKRDYSFLTGK